MGAIIGEGNFKMTWLKRLFFLLIGLVIVGGVAFGLFRKEIAARLFVAGVDQRAGADPSAEWSDGLYVYLCGTGSPMPDADRAGPCLGVLAGDKAFIFDVGSGGIRNLSSMNFPIARLESVFLTHLHSDHIDGLGELMVNSWLAGSRTTPTPVIGPVGTSAVVDGFNMAYRIDSTYRTAHHGVEVANPEGFGASAIEIRVPAGPGGKEIVVENGDLKITAIRVEHSPVDAAFAYRIDYKDRSVSISGDTIYHDGFVALSEGVDLMLHEALDPEMVSMIGTSLRERGQTGTSKIFFDIIDYHASPEDAARAAEKANADRLVLYHILPPLPVRLMESFFLGDAKSEFSGPITVGQDGMIFSLPVGSEKIEMSRGF